MTDRTRCIVSHYYWLMTSISILLLQTTSFTTAFNTVPIRSFGILNQKKIPTRGQTTTTASNSFLSMSDVPNNEHDNLSGTATTTKKPNDTIDNVVLNYITLAVQEGKEFVKNLPPKPEDMVVMVGDLLSLSIYGFFDHFICQDIVVASVKNADSPAKLGVLLSKISPQAATVVNNDYLLSTPVWVDSTTVPNLSHVLQVTVSDQLVTHYSPLLQQTGLAVTALASCWLCAGWIHQSFSFRNTLLCSTDTALLVTAKTWITSSALLFTFTALSHYVCGCENIFSFTKGDVDYIIDSLSVLVMWRFLVSYILGTGNR